VLVRWRGEALRGSVPLIHLLRERGLCAESQIGVECVRGKVGQLLCEVRRRQHISEAGGCRSCRLDKLGLYKGGRWCCVVGHR
jgi:hypothetical protein